MANFSAQKKAYDLLNGRKGSIVVIDLRDFSIPVAVSAPSISANDLRDISSKEYQALLNIPVIASGGVGKLEHLHEGLKIGRHEVCEVVSNKLSK